MGRLLAARLAGHGGAGGLVFASKDRGPQGVGAAGLSKEPKNPKKTSPRLGEEVLVWGQGEEAKQTAIKTGLKGKGSKLRAY